MDEIEQLVDELHRSARKIFKRRKVIVKGINDLYQADLVEMIPYSKQNRGFKYILIVIDVFSKRVSAQPVKNKTGVEVTKAMKKILVKPNIPGNLQTDQGKEFYNKDFKNLIKELDINHYSTYSNMKASVVERVNRTLKGMMWKLFSKRGSYKWLELLPLVVNKYNNTIHSTIGMKPNEVIKQDEQRLLKEVYTYNLISTKKPKFQKGDYVRVSKYRQIFDKGYTSNWSKEIFKIRNIKLTNPITYMLEDTRGEEILGGFYELELQKVKNPDVALIEKVLRRKGDKVLVKWQGYDSSHNSWISKSSIKNL